MEDIGGGEGREERGRLIGRGLDIIWYSRFFVVEIIRKLEGF